MERATVASIGLGIQAWMGRERFDRERVGECGWPTSPCVKPHQGFFTSSWDEDRGTSAWTESRSFRQRGDEGRWVVLLQPAPAAIIFVVQSIECFAELANQFPQAYRNPANLPRPHWGRLAELADGIHVTAEAVGDPNDAYCHAWEVESTLWFRGDVLAVVSPG